MRNMGSAYIFIGILELSRPLGRGRNKWEDNIKYPLKKYGLRA
jgi:hypothetical protein